MLRWQSFAKLVLPLMMRNQRNLDLTSIRCGDSMQIKVKVFASYLIRISYAVN